ncbi:MAG: regulatory signaling modulator protein AmpE, partial [Thioalkalispiraceae bacterium]
MNFIAIMIALGVETFYKPISHWRDYQWFTRYEQWLYGKLENASFRDSAVTVVLVFGLVFLVTAIIGNALYDFFALIGFLFATLVLIYSIGPDDLDEDVQAYLHDVEQDDAEGASHHAEKITGQVLNGKPAEVGQQVKEAIFIQGNVRMLGVIFWFVLLGPAGALLFRLSDIQNRASENQSPEYAQANQRLFYILSWVPARLSVLGYAVV